MNIRKFLNLKFSNSQPYIPSLSQTQNISGNRSRAYITKFVPSKVKKIYKNPIFLPFIIIVFLVIVVGYFVVSRIAGSKLQSGGAGDPRITIEKPKAAQTLNRQFYFPLKDAQGKEVSKFKYEIQGAELRDTIIIKGQKATAIKGRTFLVLNLKIINDFDKSIQINARDYIRLTVGQSMEKLAPDIHNDPVEIQAISTKYTRLGFPINDTDRDLTLQVGEISGRKELIKLNLR